MTAATARTAVAPACAAVAAALADPPAVDLGSSTPCADFDLRELIEHFVGTSSAMARLGQGAAIDVDDPWGGGQGVAAGDWSTRLRDNLDAISRSWSQAEVWDGEVEVGGSTMPRGMLGEMTLIEVVMHGWDLARTLGRQVELDPETAAAVAEAVAGTAEMGRRMGAYSSEITVGSGAMSLDRALGLAGRDPAWGT